MTEKVKILFLAANPKASTPLRLDEEIRQIHEKIRAAEFRDSFELQSRWAVRPLDLLQAFNEVRPHVVHFSGHGTCNAELVLEDDGGTAKPVSVAALESLFGTMKDNIRLVLLNACHSEDQARAVSKVIDCTVGMNAAIGDEAAITFASTFYGALAFGRSVGQAFEQGRVSLMLQGIPEEKTPVLLARQGVDLLDVSFVNRAPVNPVLPALAWEMLLSAVASNTALNFVRYDGGLAVLAGAKQFDCKFDLEQAAAIEHALASLVQVGWVKRTDNELFHVTHAGYAAARQFSPAPDNRFAAILRQMPKLIAEMKKDLFTEEGKHVREFFVMSRRHVLGGSEKPRFCYYEEDHDNLRGQIDILENQGYLTDVTPKNVPIYRMSEEFVRLVLESATEA
jgi:hypothetical protein